MNTISRLFSVLSSVRWVGFTCAALSAAAVGLAVWSEQALGLIPCALCLWERWPYRVAVVFGLLAFLLPPRYGRWAVLGLVALFLAEIALGVLHVGVEFGWWRSPLPSCNAPDISGVTSAEELFNRLPLRPAKPCDEPAYLVPGLPVSMAAMNLLFAVFMAAMAGLGFICGRRTRIPPVSGR